MDQLSKKLAPACFVLAGAAPAIAADLPEVSPAAALQMVLDIQQDRIRSVDTPEGWWNDTKVRAWSVKRLAEPGVLDTTPSFEVVYTIEGVAVARWRVDPSAGTAEVQRCESLEF